MPTIDPILPTPGQSNWGGTLNAAIATIVQQTNTNAGIVEGVGALALVRQNELAAQVDTAVASHGVAAAAAVAVTARDETLAAIESIHRTNGGVGYDDDGVPYLISSGLTSIGLDDDDVPYLIDL